MPPSIQSFQLSSLAKFDLWRNIKSCFGMNFGDPNLFPIFTLHSRTGHEIHRPVSLGSLASRFDGNAPAC